jgi:hypothetical protein
MSNTGGSKTKNEQFLDSLVRELQEMSDTDALEGMNAEELLKLGATMLNSVKTEAGQRRLAKAKAKLSPVSSKKSATSVSAVDARKYLSGLSNLPDLTMAARGLQDLSDEDALHLYGQMKALEDEAASEDARE